VEMLSQKVKMAVARVVTKERLRRCTCQRRMWMERGR